MRYVIVDIDGTVADSRHRNHHIQLVVGKRLTREDGVSGLIEEISHTLMDQTAFLVKWDDSEAPIWFSHSEVVPWGKVDFDAWDRDAAGDSPIMPVIAFIAAMKMSYETMKTLHGWTGVAPAFMYLTARGEGGRPETEEWLRKHELFHPEDGDLLIMRAEGDMAKDTVIKPRVVQEYLDAGHEFLCVFEDRRLVAKAFRDMGLFVFHVADYD